MSVVGGVNGRGQAVQQAVRDRFQAFLVSHVAGVDYDDPCVLYSSFRLDQCDQYPVEVVVRLS